MWGRSKRPAQILNSQGGRSLVYTSYNKPSSITQGARTISFLDDTEHQRFKQVTPEGTTLYIGAFGVLGITVTVHLTLMKDLRLAWSPAPYHGTAKSN
jgi:hypothetical protein